MAGKKKVTAKPVAAAGRGDEELLRDAAAELKYLRFLFEEASRTYINTIQAEIEQVIEVIDAVGAGSLNKEKREALGLILDRIRGAKDKVKLRKGRLKDVRKLDALVGEFNELMERWR